MKPSQSIKTILLFLILIALKPINCFAMGGSGHYILTGYALSKNGDTLKNKQILLKLKYKVDTLTTDSNGIYRTTIYWETSCPSIVHFRPKKRIDNEMNPKLYFTYNSITIKIKNDWRSMVFADYNKPETYTKKEDLIF